MHSIRAGAFDPQRGRAGAGPGIGSIVYKAGDHSRPHALRRGEAGGLPCVRSPRPIRGAAPQCPGFTRRAERGRASGPPTLQRPAIFGPGRGAPPEVRARGGPRSSSWGRLPALRIPWQTPSLPLLTGIPCFAGAARGNIWPLIAPQPAHVLRRSLPPAGSCGCGRQPPAADPFFCGLSPPDQGAREGPP